MKNKLLALLLATAGFLAIHGSAHAQCSFRNTAFNAGENLAYNLYFNWKFVWVKVGFANMITSDHSYQGKPSYRCALTTHTSRKADKFFLMRDTLLSYVGHDLAPLYYRKGAREGKRYYIDEVFYSYPQGKTHIRQHRMNAHGEHFRQENTYSDCVYDMLSIFMRSRSFNPEGWKKGHVVKIPIVDGDSRINAQLRYSGTTVVKADDGHRYRCLQLSYMEPDKGKMKEIVRFYVTDDDNHIPVRLDMFLRFGSAKAFLSSMKGTRSQIKAMVK